MKLTERFNYKITGIYIISNDITKEVYIGQSKNICARIYQHLNSSITETRSDYNYPLHKAFRKYGIDNFSFEILEECPYELLNEKEQFWINKYDAYNTGYNQTYGGKQSIRKIKLTHENVCEIRKLLAESDKTILDISLQYNICSDMVARINSGEAWHDNAIQYPIRTHYIQDIYTQYHYTGIIVCQYDKTTGNLIAKFPTVSIAAKVALNNVECCHHIGENIAGKRKSAYNYIWTVEEATKEDWLTLLKHFI